MVNLQAGKLRGIVAISAPSQTTAEPQRKNEMEWEEALLTAWGGEIPPHAAAFYRRQAARVSAASRSSPAGRGRGDNPGREGTATR